MKYDTFIFDMDGTLSDTSPGVFAGLRITFDALGMPVPEEAVLRRFIGPPLLSSFKRELGMDDCEAERAAAVSGPTIRKRACFSVSSIRG